VRILRTVTAFRPAVFYGGPSVGAARHAASSAERGHQVTVVTSNVLELKPVRFVDSHEPRLGGVDVRYFPSRVLRSHPAFIVSTELSRWLQQHVKGYDVVHVSFSREWIPVRAAQIAIGKGVPTFLQLHGMLGRTDGVRGVIDRLWVKRLLDCATGVFSLQEQEDNEIRRITPRARVLRLPNAVSLPPHTTETWAVGNLVNPVVLFLARLHPRKRVLAFVEMARILRDQGVAARYRVVGPDGGDLVAAQRLVREYDLQDRITFVGSLRGEAVFQEYLNSAVYVLPAVNEPWGRTILEALGVGVPTVVTDTCFIAPTLEKSGAAMVSAPEPKALSESVERILREPEVAKRLSSAGRRFVRAQLTPAQVAELLQSYYSNAHARTR
jgi:glycosyltransferase involved in cell wall biosynthesis